jgi:aminopeptidase N
VANYRVNITLDDEYAVASSGQLIKKDSKDGRSSYEYSLEKARDFAFVLSTEYEMLFEEVDGVTVNYYYHSDKAPKTSLDTAVKALKTFNNLFCKYPYSTYSVCETGLNEGGMEYPGLVMISDDINEQISYQEVIVHETAHQWWYSLVGNDEIKYGFLDEGLTEYSTVLFFENNPEYGLTRDSLIKIAKSTYSTYCSVYEKVFGDKDTTMLRALPEYSGAYEYVNIAYVKGALMFDYLREGLGDELFYKGLKKYADDYSYSLATPDCLVGAFESVGANTNAFFKSWFNGEVII